MRQSLELWSQNAEARLNLGAACAAQGNHAAAVEQFTLATQLDPKLTRAHNWPQAGSGLARSQFKLNRLPEAAEACRRLLELEPNDAQSMQRLCEILVQLGQADEAKRQYEEGLRRNPNSTGGACLGRQRSAFAQEKSPLSRLGD